MPRAEPLDQPALAISPGVGLPRVPLSRGRLMSIYPLSNLLEPDLRRSGSICHAWLYRVGKIENKLIVPTRKLLDQRRFDVGQFVFLRDGFLQRLHPPYLFDDDLLAVILSGLAMTHDDASGFKRQELLEES